MTNRDKFRMELIDKRNAEIEALKQEIALIRLRIEELEEDNEITRSRMGTN